jgi:hypothetical protein
MPILLVFLSETGLAMFKISLLFMAFWDAALQHGGIRMRFLRPIPTSPAALAADREMLRDAFPCGAAKSASS